MGTSNFGGVVSRIKDYKEEIKNTISTDRNGILDFFFIIFYSTNYSSKIRSAHIIIIIY
jgi:hypothetical protein